ncbi:MAG: Na+/H+ antiporter NhaA [Desulfobacteraceae bacterium]|nr:Na+/H+ antiporter NhaA [Desulfobacteraceae bacterium]
MTPATAKEVNAFQRFFSHEVLGTLPLFVATAAALLWANLHFSSYQHFWHAELGIYIGPYGVTKSLAHWIDEALMAIFFFTVGLEIKYEVLVGELASFRKSLLPIVGAVGGMLVPALVYVAFNRGQATLHGWGIPMATDIAFALAVLATLGTRVPLGLRVFLSALAIADDLGAVMVIALFYSQKIATGYLLMAVGFILLLIIANRYWVQHALVYALLGIGVWAAFLGAGIHATVAGVLVAAFVPARGEYATDAFLQRVNHHLKQFQCAIDDCGFSLLTNSRQLDAVRAIEENCFEVEPPLQRLEFALHPWVTYLIIPLFALAHAGLYLGDLNVSQAIAHPLTLGILLGLLAGKPAGIALFTLAVSKVFRIELPQGVTAHHIMGAGCLGGIGFTMSLFISNLSFTDPQMIDFAKLGILLASLLSAVIGAVILFKGRPVTEMPAEKR